MRVPHLEQELDYSCLAACVRMVLAFYGCERTEAELRALLKTRPGGTSPRSGDGRLPELGFDAYGRSHYPTGKKKSSMPWLSLI